MRHVLSASGINGIYQSVFSINAFNYGAGAITLASLAVTLAALLTVSLSIIKTLNIKHRACKIKARTEPDSNH